MMIATYIILAKSKFYGETLYDYRILAKSKFYGESLYDDSYIYYISKV